MSEQATKIKENPDEFLIEYTNRLIVQHLLLTEDHLLDFAREPSDQCISCLYWHLEKLVAYSSLECVKFEGMDASACQVLSSWATKVQQSLPSLTKEQALDLAKEAREFRYKMSGAEESALTFNDIIKLLDSKAQLAHAIYHPMTVENPTRTKKVIVKALLDTASAMSGIAPVDNKELGLEPEGIMHFTQTDGSITSVPYATSRITINGQSYQQPILIGVTEPIIGFIDAQIRNLRPYNLSEIKLLEKEAEMGEKRKPMRISDLHSWAASGESHLKSWLDWQYLPRELVPLTAQAADALHDLASFIGQYMERFPNTPDQAEMEVGKSAIIEGRKCELVKNYYHCRLKPKEYFDKRSFRVVTPREGVRLTIGCKKGHWNPKGKKGEQCGIGTEAQSIMYHKRLYAEEGIKLDQKRIEELAYELANLVLTKPSAQDDIAKVAFEIMEELRVPPYYKAEDKLSNSEDKEFGEIFEALKPKNIIEVEA